MRAASADWVRALERTAPVTPDSTRTLAVIVDETAIRTPDAVALVGETETLSYAALAALSNRYSRWALDQGLRPGDRVALLMANAPTYAAIWIGLSRIGIVTALLNTQLLGPALAHCIGVVDARRLIVDAKLLEAVATIEGQGAPEIWIHGGSVCSHAPLSHGRLDTAVSAFDGAPLTTAERHRVALRDEALLIFTSGTTGLPKAARVSHYRIIMWAEWFAGILDARHDDRLFDCLPMYHSVGGVVAVGAMLVAGGGVIVRDGFSASLFWADVRQSGATIVQYIGELCRYLLAAPPSDDDGGHGVRLFCGNGLRADVWRPFETRFAVPRIIEFYAATEGSFSLFNLEGKPGSIGRVPRFLAHRSPVALVRLDANAERPQRAAGGFCIRCAADEIGEAIGQIEAAQAGATGLARRFEGYTNTVDSDAKILRDVFAPGDAWFRTGDLMKRDAEGFFSFVDRIGDTFRWKGENVSTAEVADSICAFEGVLTANVYGVVVPEQDGRAGMAAIVTGPAFDLAGFHRHLDARLPRYARPVFLRLCQSLDLTGTLKMKKTTAVDEGFDPARVGDDLYVDDGTLYRPLTPELHESIRAGRERL